MSDIEKVAVFDDRIVQSKPKYGVDKGALSLTSAPFNAISANQSQQTYQIQVPSENVFLARDVDWSAQCLLQATLTYPATPVAGDILLAIGSTVALASFPLHRLVSTLSATINDTTTTINTSDVLNEVLRLADTKKNRSLKTCPSYLDNYQNYNLARGTNNNPLAGYSQNLYNTAVPNGAYTGLYFTSPTGQRLVGSGWYVDASLAATHQAVYYKNGVPQFAGTGGAAPPEPLPAGQTQWLFTSNPSIPIYLGFNSTEKIVLSPFIFADSHESETGLFGIQNIQLLMNMINPSLNGLVGRVLRYDNTGAGVGRVATLSNLQYNLSASNATPFQNAITQVQFLTPSLDLPLPPKSIVNYMEFPRYVTVLSNPSWQLNGATGVYSAYIQSQTITLPSIPDMMIIYAKPTTYATSDADWYMPISKISMNFDNFSGLLSSHTQEQLYQLSYNNGLEMDYNQWVGSSYNAGAPSALTGGFLVVRPGKDLTLQTGQASGLQGNYTFQFNATVNCNNAQYPVAPTGAGNPYTNNNINLWVITVNSGYFESIKGSSRIIKNVVTEADVINAPLANITTRAEVNRYVGGVGLKNIMNTAVGAIKHLAPSVRNAVSAVQEALPHVRGIKNAISRRLM